MRAKLHASLPEAVDVVVYAVEHEPARRRYELALELEPEWERVQQRSFVRIAAYGLPVRVVRLAGAQEDGEDVRMSSIKT